MLILLFNAIQIHCMAVVLFTVQSHPAPPGYSPGTDNEDVQNCLQLSVAGQKLSFYYQVLAKVTVKQSV